MLAAPLSVLLLAASPALAADPAVVFRAASRYEATLQVSGPYTLELRLGDGAWTALVPGRPLPLDRAEVAGLKSWSVRYTRAAWEAREARLTTELGKDDDLPGDARKEVQAWLAANPDAPRDATFAALDRVLTEALADSERRWNAGRKDRLRTAHVKLRAKLEELSLRCEIGQDVLDALPDATVTCYEDLYSGDEDCYREDSLLKPLAGLVLNAYCASQVETAISAAQATVRRPDFEAELARGRKALSATRALLDANDAVLAASEGASDAYAGLFRAHDTKDWTFSKQGATPWATAGWGVAAWKTELGEDWERGGLLSQQVRVALALHPEVRLDRASRGFVRVYGDLGWERVAMDLDPDDGFVAAGNLVDEENGASLAYDFVTAGADLRVAWSGTWLGLGGGGMLPFGSRLSATGGQEGGVASFPAFAPAPYGRVSLGGYTPTRQGAHMDGFYVEVSAQAYPFAAGTPTERYDVERPDGERVPLPPGGQPVVDLRVTLGFAL